MKIKIEIEISADEQVARLRMNDGPEHTVGIEETLDDRRLRVRGQFGILSATGSLLPVWIDVRPFSIRLHKHASELLEKLRPKNET